MAEKLDSFTPKDFEKKLNDINIKIKIGDLIGRGGQKHVYSATMENGLQAVVFKIMIPSENIIERVKREIRATTLIEHNNIPKIIQSNVNNQLDSEELIWIIEEFIDGSSLRKLLTDGKTFNIHEIISFLDTMFSILKKSEKLSIVHRDIKPENILVDPKGNFWLIDFGISRHLDLESITSSNAPIGPHTLGYSASEQFRNRKKDIDIRADFFSIGVVG